MLMMVHPLDFRGRVGRDFIRRTEKSGGDTVRAFFPHQSVEQDEGCNDANSGTKGG